MKRQLIECKKLMSQYQLTCPGARAITSNRGKTHEERQPSISISKSSLPSWRFRLHLQLLPRTNHASSRQVSTRLGRIDSVRPSNKATMDATAGRVMKELGLGLAEQMSIADSRLKLDKLQLESLAKFMICEQELIGNSDCLAELTYHAFYYTIIIVSFAFLSAQFKSADSSFIRNFSNLVSWTNFSLVAIACAHIYSRILELERIMLLILASHVQLYSRPNGGRNETGRGAGGEINRTRQASDIVRPYSFVADMWIKFVRTTSNDIERYCTRPFGFKMTYENIIELNFFIIFAYSLSVGRD